MKPVQFVSIAFTFALMASPTLAKQHLNHRPANSASPLCASAANNEAGASLVRMDLEMKAMVEMHGRILAAASMQDRDALMTAHAKAMRDSMTMLNGISSQAPCGRRVDTLAQHQAMETRMDILQSMLQSMLDRMPMTLEK